MHGWPWGTYMELHQLRYFVTAARSGTISRAAEILYLSQPSLSVQIRKLEKELGTPLFERLGRRLALTPAGRVLMPHAERALLEVEGGKNSVLDIIKPGAERLAVGLPPTLDPFQLVGAMAGLHAAHPELSLQLREESSDSALEDLVETGELDVGLVRVSTSRSLLQYRPFRREPLLAFAAVGHPLLARGAIPVAELAGQPLITLKPGLGLGELVSSLCRRSGFEPHIVFETGQLCLVPGLALAGLGVGLAPGSDMLPRGQCSAVDDPDAAWELSACHRRDRPLSSPAVALLDLMETKARAGDTG
jgi:DNA-binding transcriptional LysR family regulator